MSMLDHIHTFARCVAEDGHRYGRHKGDLTMTLPERQWMALVAECAARANYGCTDVPRSMYEPITLSHGYGFNVIVSGPARPIPTTQPGGEVNVPKLLVHELGIGRLYDDVSAEPEEEVGDTGCAFKCMDCGAAVLDLGPMKTPYYCQACIDLRVMKQLEPCERCGLISHNGLRGSEAQQMLDAQRENAARDLAKGGEGFFLQIPAQRTFEVLPIPYHNVIWSKLPCGCMPPCTKNHSEFT